MPSGVVLVTGASTGIGEATALHLRELGFEPVAGVRRDEDAERLGAQGLRTVRLDVTDEAQISAARESVGDGALVGLVNNAGVAVAAPLEFVPLDQLRRQLEVNLIGQVAVTQAFLPALRRAGGRIVNVGSIGGRGCPEGDPEDRARARPAAPRGRRGHRKGAHRGPPTHPVRGGRRGEGARPVGASPARPRHGQADRPRARRMISRMGRLSHRPAPGKAAAQQEEQAGGHRQGER